jgi:small GTP-binding protein
MDYGNRKPNNNNNSPTLARDFNLEDSKISIDRLFYGFKVILIGDIQVGKTSIFNQFIEQKYQRNYGATLSVDFKVKSIFIDDNTVADLQVWDTCGEERFKTITRQYYRDINGCFLIFDLTSLNSFEGAEKWLADIKEHGPEYTVVMLVGNKCDLVDERKIAYNDSKNFADNNGLDYIEVSAVTGENVKLIFEEMTKAMIKLNEFQESKKRRDNPNGSRITQKNKKLSVHESRITVTEGDNNGCCK